MKRLIPTISFVSLCVILSIAPSQLIFADTKKLQIIRFYKLNSKGQQNRLIIRESRLKKTGCQDFSTEPTVFRLVQIGFKQCRVFQQKNCEASSIVEGLWKGDKPDTQFTQGGEWLFTQYSPEGVEAKSWECE